jgi:hypothetical protein
MAYQYGPRGVVERTYLVLRNHGCGFAASVGFTKPDIAGQRSGRARTEVTHGTSRSDFTIGYLCVDQGDFDTRPICETHTADTWEGPRVGSGRLGARHWHLRSGVRSLRLTNHFGLGRRIGQRITGPAGFVGTAVTPASEWVGISIEAAGGTVS